MLNIYYAILNASKKLIFDGGRFSINNSRQRTWRHNIMKKLFLFVSAILFFAILIFVIWTKLFYVKVNVALEPKIVVQNEIGIHVDRHDMSEVASQIEEEEVPAVQSTPNDEETEPVDWLARFRAAAEKYRNEQAAVGVTDEEPVRATRKTNEAPVIEKTIDSFIPKYEEVVIEEKAEYYYLSGIGGLKDIAQGLDKAAKKASVDYVFTMDAGLSLFKPIRPFSVIHAYVRPQDREYFEKTLKLTEVSKSSAQLCLLMSDEKDLYASKAEMYGLSVVSKERLKLDLISNGEKDLVSELDNLA
jgi:hypothetical protein